MNLSIGLLTFASVSSLLSPTANGFELRENSSHSSVVAQTSSEETSVQTNSTRVDIEDRIQGSVGSTSREYTFSGNANEMIVVYIEAYQGYTYDTSLVLTDAEGNVVTGRDSYHEGLDLAESEGRHKVYLLPMTGEYRLAFDSIAYDGEEVEPADYLLRARLASYPERLIIHGSRMMDKAQYDEAITAFTLAIEESPEQPLPYMGRIFANTLPIFDDPAFEDEDDAFREDPFGFVYEVFKTLEPETQLMVVEDMKQTHLVINNMIAEGRATPETIDIDPELLAEGAAFLETGIASDEFKEMIEEFL